MTSRERLLAALRLETPDRVPVGPYISPKWLASAEAGVFERLVRECDILLSTALGGDQFLGARAANHVRTWSEENRIITTIETPKGELRSVTTTTKQTSCCTEFFLKGPEDVERLLSFHYEPPEADVSAYREAVATYGEELLVLGGCTDAVFLPAFWFSPEDFMIACIEDFDTIEKLLRLAQTRALDYVRSAMKQGVRAFRIIGAEVASQTLMDPTWYAKLVAPYDSELHAEIRKAGSIAYMHCHGKINDILEQIADTGPTGLDPLERAPGGNLTLADAKRRIGDRVCLVGNLDDLEFIGAKSREEVFDASVECIRAAGPGGYILGGTASGIYTPPMAEGFLTMAEASRKLAG